MDEVDKKIVEILRDDSRTTFSQIARDLGISDVAVYKRVKKLQDEGIIKRFTLVIDPRAMGREVIAYVLMKTLANHTIPIAERLREEEWVSEIYTLVGEYDIIAKVETSSIQSLKEFVERRLRNMEGILDLRTSIVFTVFKENI
ncbi:MAG: Lrp/AsnC family transcriptional regulator [Candidatus Hydrothermarchaeota archaeon]